MSKRQITLKDGKTYSVDTSRPGVMLNDRLFELAKSFIEHLAPLDLDEKIPYGYQKLGCMILDKEKDMIKLEWVDDCNFSNLKKYENNLETMLGRNYTTKRYIIYALLECIRSGLDHQKCYLKIVDPNNFHITDIYI